MLVQLRLDEKLHEVADEGGVWKPAFSPLGLADVHVGGLEEALVQELARRLGHRPMRRIHLSTQEERADSEKGRLGVGVCTSS